MKDLIIQNRAMTEEEFMEFIKDKLNIHHSYENLMMIINNAEKSNLKNNPVHEELVYSYTLSILHKRSTFKIEYDSKTEEDMVSMETISVRKALQLAAEKFPNLDVTPNPTYFYAWCNKQGLSSKKDRLIAEIMDDNFIIPI